MLNQKVTYLLGAGASANSIPVVNAFKERFKIFLNHLNTYCKNKSGFNKNNFEKFSNDQKAILKGIDSHYTIDTYAKKLFLQNPLLQTNTEYNTLINYLTCYFLYEQLTIDLEKSCNWYLRDQINQIGYSNEFDDLYYECLKRIPINLDYRYDSLFAGILENDNDNKIVIPTGFNFISWNYDFQIEKSLMNFTNENLEETMQKLNVIGTKQKYDENKDSGNLIKLNGTAGFIGNEKFSELFDFKKNELDNNSFDIFLEILSDRRNKYHNSLRFAWVINEDNDKILKKANEILRASAYIVIIGYSFPYFNREIDRKLFEGVVTGSKPGSKIFIQAHENDIKSIKQRFKAIAWSIEPEIFTELDQFLLPHGL